MDYAMISLMNIEAYYRRQRWKVASLMGTLIAILFVLFSLALAVWMAVSAFHEAVGDTAQKLHAAFLIAQTVFYPMAGCGIIPMFIISTLGIYYRSHGVGHALLDHYWKNPYVIDNRRRCG